MAHDHRFKCSDVPGIFICKCGAEKYYDRSTGQYIMREAE